MGWSAQATFFLLAAAVQAGLGVAIVLRRPRVEWALVLGAIFLGNAALAVNSLLVTVGATAWASGPASARIFYDFDRTTTLLIAYLALAYPRRPAWARRPWVLPLLFAAIWASVILPRALGAVYYVEIPSSLVPAGCPDPCLRGTAIQYWSYQVTNVGFLVLLVRWAYLLPRVASPVDLAHLRLLFAAFAVRAIHVEFLIYKAAPLDLLFREDPFGGLDPWLPVFYVRAALSHLAILTAAGLLLWGRGHLPSDRRRAVDFVLVFFLLGALEALLSRGQAIFGYAGSQARYYYSALLHLDVLVLRPVLVVYAMLRYDFLGSWARSRQAMLAVAAILSAMGYSAGIYPALREATLGSGVAWAITVPIAAGLGVATAAILHTYVGPTPNVAAQRYLALLEDLHRNGHPGPAALAALAKDRERLGVDPAQAQALEAAVASRWAGNASWLPGQRVAGRYELRGILAAGGWGEVYLADDAVDGRTVVLKRTKALSPIERKALLAEAYALTKLSHPHLVPLLRSEVVDGEPLLVLEHMPGGTLAARLADGRLDRRDAHRAAHGLLWALTAVHGAGIVHGDVKPGNLLYDADGKVRLGDFGLARPLAPAAEHALGDPTPTSRAQGTVRYLAPEQARGGEATPASDVYAAGLVVLEALTGGHPIPVGLPDYEQRRRAAEERVILPEGLGAWAPLLAAMLDPDPARRPTAAQALARLPSPRGTAEGSGLPPARRRTRAGPTGRVPGPSS